MSKSIVEFYPEKENSKCGYCKKNNASVSQGMWAHILTVEDYQALIDRGWRRSGKYCYKPTMDQTCCPLYTIKCNAIDLKLSKSQKKTLKKVNKFLSKNNDYETNCNDDTSMTDEPNQNASTSQNCDEQDVLQVMRNKEHLKINVNNIKFKSKQECIDEGTSTLTIPIKNDVKRVTEINNEATHCKKAKEIRIQRKREKLLQKGIDIESIQNLPTSKSKEKSLEEFLNDLPENFRDRLQIKLVRTTPPGPEWIASSSASHELYTKYQVSIHGDSVSKCSEQQFLKFLVKSPLQADFPDDGPACGYGSFHQQYWLDNELVAVGVIDILPKCVSSVYFFYNPKYSHLSLGSFGALKELAFTRDLQQNVPSIKYYYMGFYIHSCPKMKYKGNYHPSFLLCPETYKWFPLTECSKKLEESPYSRLNPDVDEIDTNMCEKRDLLDVLVLQGNTYMTYGSYKAYKARNAPAERKRFAEQLDDADVLLYAQLVGKDTSQRIILVEE